MYIQAVSMDFRNQLNDHGWACVPSVSNKKELLDLAKSIGTPMLSPSGRVVRELRPRLPRDSPMGTLSSSFSTGSFPLHTDTAFWPMPARYLVFRVEGDYRRVT